MTDPPPRPTAAAPDPPAQLAALRRAAATDAPTLVELHAIADGLGALAGAAPRLGLPVQRVAVAGALTTGLLARAIATAILREGVFPIVHETAFGSYAHEILDPDSALHRFAPDLTVLVPDWRALVVPHSIDASAAAVADDVAAQVRRFEALWQRLEARGSRIIQHTLVPPPARFRGIAERLAPASIARHVRALDDALVEAGARRVFWLEADRLAMQVGLDAWTAERFFFAGRLGFDPRFLVDYLPWFQGAWRAVHGRDKKVLALDLDDTLWGGVIGDDGLDGIRLGPDGGPAGEAFAAWQHYVKALGRRGVILAACSKNSPESAAQGFAHPHAALALDDFAAFECSWADKASALRRIARALDVGLDAIVFADDNPAEIELIRQTLPEVATVALGADPTGFVARLEAGHWFDLARYTAADTGRADAYRARRDAAAAAPPGTDLVGYLRSLEMVARIARAGPAELDRLAQLELRTNQFNPTTRRYGTRDLERRLADPDAVVLAFWLRDRFGDHGLTSMLIALPEDEALRIDDWVMSCRIFGRGAEAVLMRRLIEAARRSGRSAVIGEYVPTARNGVVADLYPRLGFAASSADGRWWRRAVAAPIDDLDGQIALDAA